MMKKICFTGYRPFKLPFEIDKNSLPYKNFYFKAYSVISSQVKEGHTYFITGMAQGCDLILASIVLELKKTVNEIFLECVLPFIPEQKPLGEYGRLYDAVLKGGDKITVLENGYSIKAYFHRNRYMVDNSDIVIAVFDGKTGGTKFTCDYAAKRGRKIIVINPSNGNVEYQTEIDGL